MRSENRKSKIEKLKKALIGMKSVVVAYSGGLDSTFLLKMAIDTLGRDNVIAVTARSETYPLSEYRESVRLAKGMKARQMTIHTSEMAVKGFRANPVNRCYYCKRELFRDLEAIRKKRGMECVLDGTNFDDLKDIRHGRSAAQELGVASPLLESGITKDEIRKHSKRLGLATWEKPSFACLASRIPFGHPINAKDLGTIEKAEEFLRGIGFKQVRVRLHKDIARLEFSGKDIAKAARMKDVIVKKLKGLGPVYVTLDLMGYRTGSMHEADAVRNIAY